MSKASLQQLRRWFFGLSIGLILVLAVGLSVGRWFMLSLMDYKSDLERLISDAPSYQISVGQLDGRWVYLSPRLEATQVKVTLEGGRRIDVGRMELELDTFRSLWRGEAVFRQVLLDQLDLSLYRSRQQGWDFAGAESDADPTPSSSPSAASKNSLLSVLQALLVHQELEIRNALVQVQFEQHEPLAPQLINIKLQNQGDQYALLGRLVLGQEQAIELRAVLHGFPGEEGFSSEFYFNAPDLDQFFWGQFFDQQVSFPQRLLLGAELWGHWRPDGQHQLQGSVRLPALDWQRDSERLGVTGGALRLTAVLDGLQHADVAVTELQGQFDGVALPLERFSLRKQDTLWSISSDRLELAPLWQIISNSSLVAAELKQKLAGLDPVGLLVNPRFEWQLAAKQDQFSFDFSSNLQDVGVSPWHGAPGLQGVTGLLQLNPSGGRIDFSSASFDMNFPQLYSQGWQFDHAKGVVSWVLAPKGVRVVSEHLQLKTPSLRANGRFSLELPAAAEPNSEGRLVLMIGMEQADATLAPLFIPDKIVSESLFSWLQQSIKAGQITQGGLIVDMPLRVPAEQQPASTLQMFFDVDQASLEYQPEWPAVTQANPLVLIKGSELLVEIPRGKLLNSALSRGRVYLPPHSSRLRVDAELEGPSADIRTTLVEGPTRKILGEALAPWQLDGVSHSSLALGIDLRQPESSQIRIESRLSEGLLSNTSLGLDFSQLAGTLNYHESDGLSSGRLSGSVLGQPLQATITTEPRSDGQHTLISGDGWVGMEPLRQWLQLPLLKRLQGETQFQAQLDICTTSPGCSSLRIDSQLRGVVADLPVPFAKNRDEQQPLAIDISLETQPHLRLRYANGLDMALPLTPSFSGAELVLGAGQPAPSSRSDGLWVRGQLDFLAVTPWQDFINQEFLKPEQAEDVDPGAVSNSEHGVKRVQLDIGRLDYGALQIYQLQALLTPGANGWVLALDSPAVRGRVVLPQDDAVMLVELDHLKLPRSKSAPLTPDDDSAKVSFDPALDPLREFDPRTIPFMQVSIASLEHGEQDLGRWRFKLQPQNNGLLLNEVTGALGSLNVKANLDWHFFEQQHSSWLDLSLSTRDVGKVVSEWGATPGLTTESAQVSGKISWQGSPLAFNWQTLNGDAALQVKKGRVLDAGSGTEVMKIFSLFNTNTIWRRLSLDFSDLAKDGISFDTIVGQYQIVDGIATSVVPMDVQGPTFNLALEGSFDLYHETLSQKMLVTLPITENLALAAVFLATPQIAGAVFLVDKLIGKQLSRFTSVRYSIEGAWANPQMSLLKPPENTQQQMATDQ